MNLRAKIAVAAGVLLLAGCRELPRYFAGDTTIARAGGKDLRLGDVRSVVPQGLSGDDSAAFMKVYIDRWVLKQLKLQEAETLFSSSAGDIDKMVEEYRQALLIRQPKNAKDWQNILTALATQKLVEGGPVTGFSAGRVTFTCDKAVSWTLDGEFGGERTVTAIENLPRAFVLACGA